MTDTTVDDLCAELEAGLDGTTDGPWQVVETLHPWRLPARGDAPDREGNHTERRIFTTWDDGQLKAPWPIVNMSIGISCEPKQPVHFLHIDAKDAAHIARCSPDNIRALLEDRKRLQAELKQANLAIEALNICIKQDDEREAALQARLAEAVEALRPFAEAANDWSDDANSGFRFADSVRLNSGSKITVGDLRRARALVGGE